jgi:hypothetical protein
VESAFASTQWGGLPDGIRASLRAHLLHQILDRINH